MGYRDSDPLLNSVQQSDHLLREASGAANQMIHDVTGPLHWFPKVTDKIIEQSPKVDTLTFFLLHESYLACGRRPLKIIVHQVLFIRPLERDK